MIVSGSSHLRNWAILEVLNISVSRTDRPDDFCSVLKYSDIAGLERSIDAAYQIAGQRLFEVFLGKFKLLDHLSALKNYLMLGHGDFSDRLMEALGYNLPLT